MRKLYVGLWFVCMLLGGKHLFAQQSEYLFSHQEFHIQDGLSHHVVNDVFQDRRGFIWLATNLGINRYDGHEIKFWTAASAGIEENVIHHIAEDSEGLLWLCQWERPLVQYRIKKLFFFHSLTHQSISLEEKFGDSFPLALEDLQAFFQTEKGEMALIGKTKSWLYHHEKGFRPLQLPENVSFVAYHGEKALFLMQGTDLLQVDMNGQEINRFPLPNRIDIPQEYVKLIYNAIPFGPGRLVMATFPGTLGRKEDGSYDVIRPFTFGQERFAVLNDTSLFVTQGGVIQVFDAELNQILGLQPYFREVTKSRINDILITEEGAILLATHNGFLVLSVQKNRFQNLLPKTSLQAFPAFDNPRNGIRGIVEYKDWLIAKAPPFLEQIHLKTGEIQLKELVGGNPIILSKKGEVLSLDRNKEIISYDPITQQIQEIKGSLDFQKEPWALYEDVNGTIWVSVTGNGLWYLNTGADKRLEELVDYGEFEDIKSGLVLAFIEEKPDRIWLCSSTGLYLMDPNQGILARYGAQEQGEFFLPATDIHHLYIDAEGIFWLATAAQGLLRWDRSESDPTRRFQHFGMEQGFSSNELYAVYEDANSYLWLPSSYGLIQFDKQAQTFKIYQEGDGITHGEFNRISHFQSPTGKLYFGGLDGITAFHPRDFKQGRSYAQPIHIADFQVFDGKQNELVGQYASVVESRSIVMHPADRFFILKVRLQDYLPHNSVKYSYRVASLSENWQTMEGNSLQLSGLPYGKHQLQIQARGRENSLSNEELSLEIRVLRPLYLSPYFLVLMVSLLVLAIWLLVRWRTFRLRQRQIALRRLSKSGPSKLRFRLKA